MGIVFLLQSPDFPKAYLGHTKDTIDKFPKGLKNRSFSPIIATNNYKFEIVYQGDDYLSQLPTIFRQYPKKSLVNIQCPAQTSTEYARAYYHNVIKPNRGEEYTQLNRYHMNREAILRQMALKNVEKYGRRPTNRTIEKYGITEQEIHQAMRDRLDKLSVPKDNDNTKSKDDDHK